jgi:hypothetical protein
MLEIILGYLHIVSFPIATPRIGFTLATIPPMLPYNCTMQAPYQGLASMFQERILLQRWGGLARFGQNFPKRTYKANMFVNKNVIQIELYNCDYVTTQHTLMRNLPECMEYLPPKTNLPQLAQAFAFAKNSLQYSNQVYKSSFALFQFGQ